jgi:hypothetical protein
VDVIRTHLHTLKGQSAMHWRINSRWTEYKTPPPTVHPLIAFVIVAAHAWTGRVESYGTTDGESASLSWNKAPIWGLWPDFYYCRTVAGLLMWGRAPRLHLLLPTCFMRFFARHICRPWSLWRRRLSFNGLHGVISHKTEVFKPITCSLKLFNLIFISGRTYVSYF